MQGTAILFTQALPARFAWIAVCLAGLPSRVQVAKEACGAADPAGTHLAASEPVQQLFVRFMADLQRWK